jgi:hypothetical protein
MKRLESKAERKKENMPCLVKAYYALMRITYFM